MKTKNRCLVLLALLVLAVAACGEGPAGPEVADGRLVPELAKPEGNPGGNGKPEKPSGDIPLEVLFAGCLDGIPCGIRSDLEAGGDYASDTYVDGEHFVSARIKTIGQFYFRSFAGKRKYDPVRGVRVVVDEDSVVAWNQDYLDDFKEDLVLAGDSWPDFTSDVTLHTRRYDGGMYTMAVDSTLVDGGKIGFNDYGDGDAWEWRLLFDTRVDTDGDGVADAADAVGLCVTHPDESTWHVTTDGADCGPEGGGVDSVTELWRVQGGVFTHVADFRTPMHLTLTRN